MKKLKALASDEDLIKEAGIEKEDYKKEEAILLIIG